MKKLNPPQKVTLVLTLAYSAWVRLQDLGYSEFQGDEILTLDFKDYPGSFLQYLLTRDKGPLQFVINWITYQLTQGFEEWVIRLPYALAGIAFVYVLFEVTRRITKNNWAGIITALLAGSNGLFIAFSRITQYQAFVQLLLGLVILFLLAVENKKAGQGKAPGARECGYFCLAGIIFGIAVLAHYDALTFLAFICFYFGKDLITRVILRSESPNDEVASSTTRREGGNRPRCYCTVPFAEDSSASQQPGRPQNDCSSIKLGFWKKKALAFFTPFLILTAIFYIPFFLNPTAGETSGYLQRRVLGSGFMPRTLYSKILMKFYMPKEMIFALVILSCLSLYFILISANHFPFSAFRRIFSGHSDPRPPAGGSGGSEEPPATQEAFSRRGFFGVLRKSPQNDSKSKLLDLILIVTSYLLPVSLIFTFWFSTQWIKPRGSTLMFYTLTLFTLGILFFTPKIDKIKASLFAWFLASSCFYLFLNKTPRTHVYIIFIPMFILSGYTIAKLVSLIKGTKSPKETSLSCLFPTQAWGNSGFDIRVNAILKKGITLLLATTGISVLTLTLLYNHKIFVEKSPEYMWGNKKVFGREMISIDKNIANKVQGIFGFPHRRGWEKIAELYENGCLVGSYSTNEKARIPAFYLGKEPITDQETVFEKDADNIILIEAPVSWCYESLNKTPEGYIELKTYFIANHPITKIYGKENLYPNGAILCE